MWNAQHSIGADWTLFGLFPAMAPEMVEWADSAEIEVTPETLPAATKIVVLKSSIVEEGSS